MSQEIDLKKRDNDALLETGEQNRQESPVSLPRVDILETAEGLILKADLPGVKSGDMDITVEKNVLTLGGKVTAIEIGDRKPVSLSYNVRDFKREFVLSQMIDQDRISADVKNGVLTLQLPKLPESEPKKIAIG